MLTPDTTDDSVCDNSFSGIKLNIVFDSSLHLFVAVGENLANMMPHAKVGTRGSC